MTCGCADEALHVAGHASSLFAHISLVVHCAIRMKTGTPWLPDNTSAILIHVDQSLPIFGKPVDTVASDPEDRRCDFINHRFV